MARSDLVINLVKAGVRGDASNLRAAAEAIAADERAKKHGGVADRITRLLEAPSRAVPAPRGGSTTSQRDGGGAIKRTEPRYGLADLYLSASLRQACHEVIEEQHRADLLRAHGMEPRHRLLLVGPPGNGKTSMAEALAFDMALPLFTIRYDAVITSYLGETAQRLRKLFDYVRTEPCVLFFDEFDALGKERGDLHETGEIKRVVTTLLLQLDDLPSYCVLIGATNHPELLDRAAWRRFEVRLEVQAPDDELLARYFADQFKTLDGTPGYTAKRLVETLRPRSFAEAESFMLDVRRRSILSAGSKTTRTLFKERVRSWTQRNYHLKDLNDGRSTDPQTP